MPYKPGLPSPGARCLTMNVQTLIDIVVLQGGQMPPRSKALPITREHLLLQCSALEYQAMMQDDRLFSGELVKCSLDQIERHNNPGLKLNAILSVCPRGVAISQAKALDKKRRQGRSRRDLHGDPIIFKIGEKTGTISNLDGFTEMSRTALLQNLPWGWYPQ